MKLGSFPFQKALVTGGAGFIGSHIVRALLNAQIEVLSVDDYSAGKRQNLSSLVNRELLTEVEADITEQNNLKPYFKNVEIVFHNGATKKTKCMRDPHRDLEVNAEGTFNVLEMARACDVKKVVLASTGSVYGEAEYHPQDENHPLNPVSYYGVSKLAAEKYAGVFQHLYGMDVTILRYFHVYGPLQESSDDDGGVVAIFLRRALATLPLTIYSDGTQQRSFTYVEDVARANLLVATKRESYGETYNCASGLKITIQQLAETVMRICRVHDLPIKYADATPGDIKTFDVDNSKLKKLGMTTWTDLDEGLRKTVSWYLANPRQN